MGSYVSATDGQEVAAGDSVAKIPREKTSKTKDITGGLPRVAELFEARKPKECAIVTEIDGIVSSARTSRGQAAGHRDARRWRAEAREYLIPKGKHISVHEGDKVIAADPLMDGSPNPHDILRIKGERELSNTWSTRSRRSTDSRA